ncbi:hypothetical protein [Nocardia wallacei]|uniref:hypothetical protein n=1 Tax=Nocardia wallacei TaxID=480035 RepID=UPI00245616D9|nr:hypothetical protein [Nocardia wallacei]
MRIRIITVTLAAVGMLLGGATYAQAAPPAAERGPCLLGHVDPSDPNSACRLGGSPTPSEADPNGIPTLSCSRLNEGQKVSTEDADGALHHWTCMKYKDSWGHTYYEWTEVLGM